MVATTVLTGDTVFRLVIIGTGFTRYKRQVIEYRIHAFILIRLSRVQPLTKPEFARIIASLNLLILKLNIAGHWSFE